MNNDRQKVGMKGRNIGIDRKIKHATHSKKAHPPISRKGEMLKRHMPPHTHVSLHITLFLKKKIMFVISQLILWIMPMRISLPVRHVFPKR
jgi:hypothetical protein